MISSHVCSGYIIHAFMLNNLPERVYGNLLGNFFEKAPADNQKTKSKAKERKNGTGNGSVVLATCCPSITLWPRDRTISASGGLGLSHLMRIAILLYGSPVIEPCVSPAWLHPQSQTKQSHPSNAPDLFECVNLIVVLRRFTGCSNAI